MSPLKSRVLIESPDRSTINSAQGVRSKMLTSLSKVKSRVLLGAKEATDITSNQSSSNNLLKLSRLND